MTETHQLDVDYVLGHEGPTVLDFRIESNQFELGINGPKLLFTALEIRTSLRLQEGCDYAALRRLVDGFSATAYCGHTSPMDLSARIVGGALAPYISMDVGPPSMYMSHLHFSTLEDETFLQLCDRTLNPTGCSRYLIAMVPILNENVGHGDHDSHSRHHSIGAEVFESHSVGSDTSVRRSFRIEYALDPNRRKN